jgi:hypothetical protein
MGKLTWLGSAKPDDPIYKMGHVVSVGNMKPSSKDTGKKRKVLPLHPKPGKQE